MKRLNTIFCSVSILLALAFSFTGCTAGGTESDSLSASSDAEASDDDSEAGSVDTLTIADVDVWMDYPAVEFFPVFSDPDTAEPLTYTYDDSVIEIDGENNTVTCKSARNGSTVVTATGEHYSAEFTVNYGYVDKTGSEYTISGDYTRYANELGELCAAEGTDGKTTVFIGDSFFDTRYFWTDFDEVYAGKDALCCGISSTTSYDWETLVSNVLGDLSPANIAIHIGTNNVYDDNKNVPDTAAALQRMFLVMHEKYPETHIYYFGITQRADTSKAVIVSTINERMQTWCDMREWITYIDTPDQITTDMLRDGTHPKLENYSIFTEALEEAGAVIADK